MSRDNKNRKSPGITIKKRFSKPCLLCEKKINIIDYKDINFLSNFQSDRGKILPRRQSFCCAKHQRKVAEAVKRARAIGLLPYVTD